MLKSGGFFVDKNKCGFESGVFLGGAICQSGSDDRRTFFATHIFSRPTKSINVDYARITFAG